MNKTILAIVIAIFSLSAQAGFKNCFSLKVKGENDIFKMMTILNKQKTISYKVVSEGDSRFREATFHILTVGEKAARKLYESLTKPDSKIQNYLSVESGEFYEGENVCELFDNAESDL